MKDPNLWQKEEPLLTTATITAKLQLCHKLENITGSGGESSRRREDAGAPLCREAGGGG